jgi:hypothetical protein
VICDLQHRDTCGSSNNHFTRDMVEFPSRRLAACSSTWVSTSPQQRSGVLPSPARFPELHPLDPQDEHKPLCLHVSLLNTFFNVTPLPPGHRIEVLSRIALHISLKYYRLQTLQTTWFTPGAFIQDHLPAGLKSLQSQALNKDHTTVSVRLCDLQPFPWPLIVACFCTVIVLSHWSWLAAQSS